MPTDRFGAAREAAMSPLAPEHLQRFAFVQERDIDFLLVEELAASFLFRQLILGEALPGVNIAAFTPIVLHSVARSGEGSGETDIQVSLTPTADSSGGPALVLIENKLDAVFQPTQAERYRASAAEAVTSRRYALARTLLVAPDQYLGTRSEAAAFDGRVSYQAIASHFRERADGESGELGARYAHRAQVVELAISKARRGYQTIPNDQTTDFWQRYYDMTRAEAPSLCMTPPTVKGNQSLWIRFSGTLEHHPPLPNAFLIHKLEQGWVHLEFPGWAAHLAQLEDVITATGAGPTMRPRLATGSAAIGIGVPVVDARAAFADQMDAVRVGLRAAITLQHWWIENWRRLLP